MNQTDLKEFLDTKVELYNTTRFIKSDPILIPHQLRDLGAGKEDIEIIDCYYFKSFSLKCVVEFSLGFRYLL